MRSWWVMCVLVMVAGDRAPECGTQSPVHGLHCEHKPSSGKGEHNYLVSGRAVTITVHDASFSLDCNNHEDIARGDLPRFAEELLCEDAHLANCAYPSFELADVLGRLNVTTERLVLERWRTSESVRESSFAGLERLKALRLVRPANLVPFAALRPLRALERLSATDAALAVRPDDRLPSGLLDLLLDRVRLTDSEGGEGGSLEGLLRDARRLRTLVLRDEGPRGGTAALAAVRETLEVLDLRRDRLDRPPETTLPTLRNLTLYAGAGSGEWPLRELAPGLERLEAWSGTAETWPAGWLAGLPALRSALFRHCELRGLPADALRGSAALESLEVSHCRLERWDPDLLRDQTRLRVLDLSRNALSEAPLVRSPELVDLDLSHNRIRLLRPETFAALRDLRTLRLENNSIERLPELAFRSLSALRELHLGRNRLVAVSAGALPVSLRALDLSRNGLSALCPSPEPCLDRPWRSHPSLERLDLSHNALRVLTSEDLGSGVAGSLAVDYRHNPVATVVWPEGNQPGGGDRTLAGDPLVCDDRLYGFALAVHAGGPGGDAVCGSPPGLEGRPVRSVPPEELEGVALEGCPRACRCVRRKGGRAFEADCAGVPRPPVAEVRIPPEARRVLLVLDRCDLRELPELPVGVTELRAAHNGLTELPELPDSLQEVDLRNNSIAGASEGAVRRMGGGWGARAVRLGGNPLRCACADRALLDAIAARPGQFEDYEELTCADGRRPTPAGMLGCDLGPALAGVVGVALAVGALLVAVRRRRARAAEDAPIPEEAEDARYDAFVSYAHEDAQWAEGVLATRLEAHGYSVCLHARDWRPGADVPSQILRSVESARRSVVVLSSRSVRSVWARAELRTAAAHALLSPGPSLVPVSLGALPPEALDRELVSLLSLHAPLHAEDPLFWERLLRSMPPRPLAPR